MNKKNIEAVKEILIRWNPLGNQTPLIKDLNNYETEAVDILFQIDLEIDFKKTKNPQKRIQVIVKEVLNQAFNLRLTDKECEKSSELIFKLLSF